MNEDNVKTNSPKAWLLAARPKTLTGAAVPVMIGTVLALKDAEWSGFRAVPAVLCFLFAFIMQIDANFVNDYFDFKHGNDDRSMRLGPKRACAEGWITLPAMERGLQVTTGLACVIGLPLVLYGGLDMILVGVACVAFCFLYTTTLSYYGLGDVLVLVFFGIVPVCCTYYLILPTLMQTVTLEVFIMSLACGLIIDTLLLINNFRDRHNDAHDHKMTLVVRVGERWGSRLYMLSGLAGAVIAAITICAAAVSEGKPLAAVTAVALYVFYLLLHAKAYEKLVKIWQGRELNRVLGLTARNMFIFGVVTVIAVIATLL